MKSVVIFRLGSLGDTVVALPFFNRVAERYPDHHRVVLTNIPISSKAAPLLSVLGKGHLVHDALSYPAGTRSLEDLLAVHRALRRLAADDLIYMMPSRTLAGLVRDFAFLTSVGFRRIVGMPWRTSDRWAQTDEETGETEYEVERLARCLASLGPFDLDHPAAWDLHLTTSELADGIEARSAFDGLPFVVINMGGKDPSKDWGEGKWGALMSRLATEISPHGLLVVGAAEDSARASRIATHWPWTAVDQCGKAAPRVAAATMRGASLFIGHDSGPLHLASALGVPCVGLFGSFNTAHKWHPYLGENRIIHEMRGTAAIEVDRVSAAVRDVLGSRR